MISDQEKLDCANRELQIRRYAYPRWVKNGRMTQAMAAREIAYMQAIADDYRAKIDLAGHSWAAFAAKGRTGA